MSTKSKFQAIEISLLHIAFSITYQKFITENRSLIKINQFLFFFDEFGLVLHFFIGDTIKIFSWNAISTSRMVNI